MVRLRGRISSSILRAESRVFVGESSVRGFETDKGTGTDRGIGAVVPDIHQGVFSHGRSGREAVGIH